MIGLGRKEFEDRLKAFLLTSGYRWPELTFNIWVKDRFLFNIYYEARESMRCNFGLTDKPVDLNFPRFDRGWQSDVLNPYAAWLKRIGADPIPFSDACGNWVEGGLQTPNYDVLESVIYATLPRIEALASNQAFKARRGEAARP
jgi:hypothetical protein